MRKIHKHVSLAVFFPCFLLAVCLAISTTNISTDQSALLALKAHIAEDPSHLILAKNWSAGSSVCEWIGVTCGSRHLRVTALNISHMTLAGTIPPHLGNLSFLVSLDMSANNFQGELPNEFARFRRLQVLNLAFNNLTGLFPSWITSFQELQYLSLGNNRFTGVIPPSISNITKLTTLLLIDNSLQGNIPAEIFNISSLETVSLSRNSFSTGTLPDNICKHLQSLKWLSLDKTGLVGQIPSSIGQCLQLQRLSLSFNKLTGPIPQEIGNLKALEVLALAMNSLEGAIPKTIGNLTKLQLVDFSTNSLTGNIPVEIFNISSLETVAVGTNSFTTWTFPNDICQHFRSLKVFNLGQTGLVGQMPSSIGQCLQLQRLYLLRNKLTGPIPEEIGNLKTLQVLALRENSLEGSIPKTIGNLTTLQLVDFSRNNLTGDIPQEISNLYNIKEIHFDFNQLTGSIPVDLFNISTITSISFGSNNFSGLLPSTMCDTLHNLQYFHFNTNNFGGPIPISISNCSQLRQLELSENNFTGTIPNSLGDLSLLQWLGLHKNNLVSEPSSPFLNFLTTLANCKYLEAITLSDNPLNGIFPDSVGNLSSSLELIFGFNCEIRGTIPSGIGNLSGLNTLALSDNQLRGPFPNSIKNMQNIQRIYLDGNELSISLQLFCFCINLGYLDLRENPIGGSIPECFGNMTSMRYLYLNSNGLNSSLPENFFNQINLLELNLSSNSLSGSLPHEISNLKAAIRMDLSSNYFSGDIPSTVGDLQNLKALYLAHNKLQGSIPETIGNMFSLEELDLSYNFLSNSIPMSLEKLQYLTSFNVSFNNLRGEIPSGGTFANITAASFISNEALCGAQRFGVPQCPSTHGRNNHKVHQIVYILLAAMAVVVAVATCFGFIYLRHRRKEKAPNDQEGLALITQERIPYYKLMQATDGYNHRNLLGTGSFGSVYKATLDDGRIVAVKVFNLQLEGSFKSFDIECEVLRNLRHRNLTKVVSSCSNPDFKALVLEYIPNGNLEKWLYSKDYFLNVKQRLNILIDVANALQYLHCGNLTPVVHCDLKPSNVLLDDELVAHVSDFGVSKLLAHEDSITYTNTLATICYLAPEYGSEGLVSTKCDVYSFGIMMMEVFTGKSPSSEIFVENLNLKSWVKDSMPSGLTHVIDANLLKSSGKFFLEILACISSIMEVALACTEEFPSKRSNIQDVLPVLNKIKLQLLPFTEGLN